MQRTIRVGVVGTTAYAERSHLRSLRSHPQAELVAICGRNRERATEVAARFDIPNVYTDYQQMIADANLDALIVNAPDELHHPITMHALDAGLHVLCEKPLAATAAQAREMYERAQSVGVKHMSYFGSRSSIYHRYARHLIDDGFIGRPYAAHLHMSHGFFRTDAYQWRFDEQRGTGALGDLGCYLIDMARWFVGDMVRVSAQLSNLVERVHPEGRLFTPANDAASLIVEFANGAQGTLSTTVTAYQAERGQLNTVVLQGSAGTLEIQQTFRASTLRGVRADEAEWSVIDIPADWWAGVDPQTPTDVALHHSVGDRAFIDAILNDGPITPNFYDGWKVQQVIEAAFSAAHQGCSVSIPTDEPTTNGGTTQ